MRILATGYRLAFTGAAVLAFALGAGWLATRTADRSRRDATGVPRIASGRTGMPQAWVSADPAPAWVPRVKSAEMDDIKRRLLEADVRDVPYIMERLVEGGAAEEFVHALLIRWSADDPPAALQWAAGRNSPELRRALRCVVAREWAIHDLDAARQWLEQSNAPDRSELLVAMAYAVVSRSPREAVGLALQLPPGGQKPALVGQAVAEWAMHDPGAAASWTGRLEDGELRAEVVVALATMFAEEDGAGAADLALQLAADRQTIVLGAIVQRWARDEPAAAAKWIERIPPGPVQAAAAENLVATWARHAPEAVESWLESVKALPVFEPAAAALTLFRANQTPAGSGQ